MFGILSSKIHYIWALRYGNFLGVGNDARYTPSTTFDTFPFPEGLTPERSPDIFENDKRGKSIARAAQTLHQQRENWLNPSDLVKRVPEVIAGFPDRIVPISDAAAAELKIRTLTNLYNARPAWLDNAHKTLDAAVTSAYGWPTDLADDEVLSRLLVLNAARAASQA
jgi:type II restriction/modification system DNA methylase subunit YeeA